METTEVRAKAGWYLTERMPGMLRYWTGDEWAKGVAPVRSPAEVRKPDPPAGWIFLGFVVAVFGGGLVAAGLDSNLSLLVFAGWAVLGIGSIVAQAGIIAAGVRLGMQWADYQRWQRDRSNWSN